MSGSRRDPLTVNDIHEDLHDDVLAVPVEVISTLVPRAHNLTERFPQDGGLTIAQVSVSVQEEARFAKVSVKFADGAR